tara:strand:+ start:582 stop:1247 length:666 start_codon:yes stop_codon:yes gene_type:complete
MKKFKRLLFREFFLSFKNTHSLLICFLFFLLGISIFIISIGNSNIMNLNIGSSIIWVLFIFTLLLSVEQFFLKDYSDGSLKELVLLGFTSDLIIISKTLTIWVFLIFPLLLFFPFVGVMLGINLKEIYLLLAAIFISSPSLILISIIGTLITIQSNSSKIMLTILVLPFVVPIIIFGVGSIEIFFESSKPFQNFFILIAIFLITLPLTLVTGRFAFKELSN